VTPARYQRRLAEVLLVEDNPADARLIAEILRGSPVPKHLHVLGSGDEALCFLRRRAPFLDAPRPSLVVLDLNLPGRDGRDVLGELKGDPELRWIPVVVFTTSGAPSDVRHAYELQANAYVVKPVGLDAFTDVVLAMEHFWLAKAQLPGPI
jgi:CheY-like chemotaxis protein